MLNMWGKVVELVDVPFPVRQPSLSKPQVVHNNRSVAHT
jgi:hypothetical protein